VDGSDKSDRRKFWAYFKRGDYFVSAYLLIDDRVEVLEKPMSAFEELPASEERGL
ncbi:hypothetical protein GOODEAATRI_026593, partial [Goodea atripinnis]